MSDPAETEFGTTVREGVLRFSGPGRWLSTGFDGGFCEAPAAYNVTVPEGFERRDLSVYARERRTGAGFEDPGPTLLTGVEMRHARGARLGPACAVVTAGVSNPAALPIAPGGDGCGDSDGRTGTPHGDSAGEDGSPPRPGTVNCLVGTSQALDEGAMATLLATVVEAKTATLVAETGFPGTTSDAVVVGSVPTGTPTPFAGSATGVGDAARACVREAVRAALRARYPDGGLPNSVAAAAYGVSTDRRASVFSPEY